MRRKRIIMETIILLSFFGIPASANIIWTWSFENEMGWFTTDGDFVGANVPAGNYTIETSALQVTSSTITDLVGSGYTTPQEPQGFLWKGTQPARFWRSSGALEDGSHFEKDIDQGRYLYVFDVSSDPQDALLHPDCASIVYAEGGRILRPEKPAHLNPAPGTFFLACMGAGLVFWMRRQGRL